jgi:hypothetical protein
VSEKRHWVHNTAGENKDNFKYGHLEFGIGETAIGQTIITDTTSFTNVNYNELFTVAEIFINNSIQ